MANISIRGNEVFQDKWQAQSCRAPYPGSVKFLSIGNVHRWKPPSRKRWEFISRARSVFQAIHRHGSRSIENSVARAEMDANKSIGFPNEIKQARETFHPIDERPPSSLFLFSSPPRWQREGWKMKNRGRGGCTVVTPIFFSLTPLFLALPLFFFFFFFHDFYSISPLDTPTT